MLGFFIAQSIGLNHQNSLIKCEIEYKPISQTIIKPIALHRSLIFFESLYLSKDFLIKRGKKIRKIQNGDKTTKMTNNNTGIRIP